MKSQGKTAAFAAICLAAIFVAAPNASMAENKVKTETIIVPPAGSEMTGQVPAPDTPADADAIGGEVGAMPDDRSAPGTHRIPLNAIQDEESATAATDTGAPDAPDAATTDSATDEPYVAPDVLYDTDLLPPPVRRMREQILDAATSGEIENLRPVLEASEMLPTLSFGTIDDPIAFLKSSSGDQNGREILAILSEVLEAGYVHVDVGTPQEMYIWP
ncbi:MAG: hypothetical protein KDJ16_18585, partial [Hyphomicrobiales bacterium]|nr:hypothetical protein [Hyphomicrobiales bacterium]